MAKRKRQISDKAYFTLFGREMEAYAKQHELRSTAMTNGDIRKMIDEICDKLRVRFELPDDRHTRMLSLAYTAVFGRMLIK